MTRNYLCLAVSAFLLPASAAFAATRDVGSLVYDNIPEASAALADALDGYLSARQATPLGWSPKGQLLIATRFGDVDELHVVEKPAGDRRQITFRREPIAAGAFSPDPARNAVAFLEETGGSDAAQLYYQQIGDPAVPGAGVPRIKLLTDGKSVNGAAVWSNSGRELAFFTTARDGNATDIDIVEPAAGSLPHLALTGDNAAWVPLDWSPDDRKLLVLKSVAKGEGYLYVVDLGSGQKREVDAAPGKIGIAGAKFSRDGQGVYLISDRDGDYARLRYVNLFTNERTVLSASIAADVEELALSRDGHYLGFVTNEGGLGKLNLLDLKTHQDLTPPKLPAPGIIDHLSFDAEGKRLAFGYATVIQPRDAYVLDVASNRVDAWTRSEVGPVDTVKFVVPHLAQFPTFDRSEGHVRQEPVYLYEPAAPGPHPVLVLLHGGPGGQFRPGFDPFIQYLVGELGFAVAAPNLRGSSGYGKAYLALDNGTQRDDVVKDVGALIVWLGSQSSFDAKHVSIAGSGYGGYLALAALVNYNDRLVGGVDLDGISDFISFLSGTAPYAQGPLRAEYGDERDPDMRAYLRRISPLTNADRMTKPLLVVHGRNDRIVPLAQADQIVNRLRSRGGQVWYLQAKDEGQIAGRKSNRDAYYRTIAVFLAGTLAK
jgi:dipeptidyl aminopeptidase/acylaminoacyl peptidase